MHPSSFLEVGKESCAVLVSLRLSTCSYMWLVIWPVAIGGSSGVGGVDNGGSSGSRVEGTETAGLTLLYLLQHLEMITMVMTVTRMTVLMNDHTFVNALRARLQGHRQSLQVPIGFI